MNSTRQWYCFAFIGIVLTLSCYGMNSEKHRKNQNKVTEICLMQLTSLQYLNTHADKIIVGYNDQERLKRGFAYSRDIGAIRCTLDGRIDFNRYFNQKPFDYSCVKIKSSKSVSYPVDHRKIVRVVEPRLGRESYWNGKKEVDGFLYEVERKGRRESNKNMSISFELRGDEALKQAKVDLAFCYDTILTKFNHVRGSNGARISLAFLPLGMTVGIPWRAAAKIAVDSICNYIQKRPYDYSCIYVCVIKTSTTDKRYDYLYSYYETLLSRM